jgi:hypothetical protein
LHRCVEKNPEGSPIKSSKSFWLFIADIYFQKSTRSEREGAWTHAARGRTQVPSQCCYAHFWAGDERSNEWEGGHSNQTPSPQAAISINHAHHTCSSVECVTLIEKLWRGEAYHPCHCTSHMYLLTPDLAMALSAPPPPPHAPAVFSSQSCVQCVYILICLSEIQSLLI